MKKLISMVDFVLDIEQNTPKATNFSSFTAIANYEKEMYSKIISYAKFLKKPLELWMFVPCDEDGNIIPDKENHFTRNNLDDWKQAKERCLFEGCEIIEDEGLQYLKLTDKNHIAFYNFKDKFKDKIIDDFSFDYGLQLTQTAIKQLGL